MSCRKGWSSMRQSLRMALELVAYQEGTVWIGVKPKGSPLKDAIGLHTGSGEHYVEAGASIHRTWGVAFGAVSPEVERVEVRNERGEAFEGRIVPLPASFHEEYRAALGRGNQLSVRLQPGRLRRQGALDRQRDGPDSQARSHGRGEA